MCTMRCAARSSARIPTTRTFIGPASDGVDVPGPRLARLLTLVAVVSALLAPVSAATPATPTSATTAETVSQSNPTVTEQVHVERTNGGVTLTYSYDLPSNVHGLGVQFPHNDASIVSVTGFERSGQRLTWDERTDAPKIRLQLSPTSEQFGPWKSAISRENWTFLKIPRPAVSWSYTGGEPSVERTTALASEGIATAQMAYFGPVEMATQNAGGTTFRLVVPHEASVDVSRDTALETLTDASDAFDSGASEGTVTAFVLPSEGIETSVGGQAFGQSFWVRDDADIDANNPWVHEFVHTRQQFRTTSEFRWFTEASATYYAAVLTIHEKPSLYGEAAGTIRDVETPTATLARPESWPSARTPYQQGARLLAALDARIRTETNGSKTLTAVFRRLNERAEDSSGRLSTSDFQRAVEAVAGRDLSAWLRPYLYEERLAPVPNSPYTYTLGETGDPDGDGLRNDAERHLGSHPFKSDSDYDQLDDGRERELGSDPTKIDTDGDWIPDSVEEFVGTNPVSGTGVLRFLGAVVATLFWGTIDLLTSLF